MDKPTEETIGAAYKCTRQNVNMMKHLYSLKASDFCEPDKIFDCLVERGRASAMRARLNDPDHRAAIRKFLKLKP